MTTISKKRAWINWISSLEDEEILEQMIQFRKSKEKNFSNEIENAITADELKERTDAYLKSLDWKN